MSRIHFFATAKDLLAICLAVEAKLNLKILPAFEVPKQAFSGDITVYQNFADIPNLGMAAGHDRIFCQSYILIDKNIDIAPHTRARGASQTNFVTYLSPTLTEAAVDFNPAGELQDGTVIMGEVMSHMPSKESEKIVRAFKAAFQKQFGKKARGAWVGPAALARLKAGGRVTAYYAHPKPEIADIQLAEIEP